MNNKRNLIEIIKRLSFTIIMAVITTIDVHLNTSRPGTNNLEITLDKYIPFNKYFIFPYVYWFLYVAAGLIILAVINKKNYFRMLASIIIGMLICYVIYYFYPSTVTRPIINSNDFVSKIVKFIYSVDNPYNCFPSIHVLNSVFITVFMCKSLKNKKLHIIFYLSFIAITLSTLFVKQHYVLDAVSAIGLGAIIYYAVMLVTKERKVHSYKTKTSRFHKNKYETDL